jgi:hypothetical protein
MGSRHFPSDGGVLRRRDVVVEDEFLASHQAALFAAITPLGAAAMIGAADALWQTSQGTGPGLAWLFLGQRPWTALTLLLALLASALLCGWRVLKAANAYGHSRGERLAWALAGLLLGPTGLLTFFSLKARPAQRPCPSCARRRVVSRETCEHCGSPFGSPPRDGTEVLDSGAPLTSLPASP